MKKYGKVLAGIALLSSVLTGCGSAKVPQTVEQPTISVARNGEITEYLISDFGKAYYDFSELTDMAVAEADQYNSRSGLSDTDACVTVKSTELLQDGTDRICVVYQYDSADSYVGFNGQKLFYGTVAEAVSQGYSLQAAADALKSVKDGSGMTREQLQQETDKKMIVAPAGRYVYCPAKVEYISEEASMAEDGSVDGTAAEEAVYILLK